MAETNSSDITTLTVQLLSAFVSKNEVPSEGLADLIRTTRAALTEDLAAPPAPPEPNYAPAVSLRKSLSSPDHILSMIDGKPYKMLKRHLAGNGLTEKEYRERYHLPATYPMVAPNYSQMRRTLAKSSGLGRKLTKESARPAAADKSPAADPISDKSATPAKTKKAPAAAPAKTASGKGAAVKSDIGAAPIATAELSPAASSPGPRKKLSIFGAMVKNASSSSTPQGEGTTIAHSNDSATKPKAATKRATKPKSLKSALKAAGAHLGNSVKKKSDGPAA